MIKVSDDLEPDVHLRVVQLTSQLLQPTMEIEIVRFHGNTFGESRRNT